MAKKITGCNWAYEVIEGMDDKLKKRFKDAPRTANRSSSLSHRSGLEEIQDRADSENIIRKRPEAGSFKHLSLCAYQQYQTFEDTDPHEFLRKAENLPQAPRPKIIVMDQAWDFSDLLMPEKVTFLTGECERINNKRSQSWIVGDPAENPRAETNQLLKWISTERFKPKTKAVKVRSGSRRLDHGAACIGALRISNRQKDHHRLIWGYREEKDIEAALWNLASRADIILLPIREHAEISKSSYANCLEMAKKTNYITSTEFSVFSEDSSFDLIERAIKSDSFHSFDLMREKARSLIFPQSNFSGANGQYSPPNAIARHIIKLLKGGCGEAATEPDKILDKLLSCISPALEEAGLATTLKLLRSSGEKGRIGRGDTLVIPMEVQMWRRKVEGRAQSALVHTNSDLTPSDFFIDRPKKAPTKDGRQKNKHINGIDLPIIAYRKVENEIRKLTGSHKISVVISAGNSHLDLGQVSVEKLDNFIPTKRFDCAFASKKERTTKINRESRRLFQSRGTYCGAIIVGSGVVDLAEYWLDPLSQRFTHKAGSKCRNVREHQIALKKSLKTSQPKDHRSKFANFGLCIDASGRGSATEIIGIEGLVVRDESYSHWEGASIASMVTAACIANVQHIRLLSDFIGFTEYADALERGEAATKPSMLRPLKPFETRAHIQQWRSNDAFKFECLSDLMGAPPDIKGWFEGSCNFDNLQPYAEKGREVVAERYRRNKNDHDKSN